MIDKVWANLGVVLSLLESLLAIIIILLFNIPLQIKEARVRDGLARLRIQLLVFGGVLFVADVIAAYFLFLTTHRLLTVEGAMIRLVTQMLLFTFATSHLILAIIGFFIYRQQYPIENKELHKQFGEVEKGTAVIIRKAVKNS